MKFTASEQVMEKRRLERLNHLEFFMKDTRMPVNARRNMSQEACHNLLTGFFFNSHWQTALYCLRKAIDNSRMECAMSFRLFWYRRILKLDQAQIDKRFD